MLINMLPLLQKIKTTVDRSGGISSHWSNENDHQLAWTQIENELAAPLGPIEGLSQNC